MLTISQIFIAFCFIVVENEVWHLVQFFFLKSLVQVLDSWDFNFRPGLSGMAFF
jgi:hypothetical protein